MNPCNFLNCKNVSRVRGLCATHYSAEMYGTQPQERNLAAMPECDVPHCDHLAESRAEKALCYLHYQAQYRGHDPYQKRIISWKARTTCWVEDCPRQSRTQGLCSSHNKRAKEGKLEVPAHLGVVLNPECDFDGCKKLQHSKKLCKGHYDQQRRGVKLTKLREWGGYSRGEIKCELAKCKRDAVSKGLCSNHYDKLSIYKISKARLLELHEMPKCYNPGCDNTKNLHIDHNHTTGTVRGLLCTGCNTSLGFLKEERVRISGLIAYLDQFDG